MGTPGNGLCTLNTTCHTNEAFGCRNKQCPIHGPQQVKRQLRASGQLCFGVRVGLGGPGKVTVWGGFHLFHGWAGFRSFVPVDQGQKVALTLRTKAGTSTLRLKCQNYFSIIPQSGPNSYGWSMWN